MRDQEHIIARARRGDADAFEQLVEAYRNQVFRLALRMCGNEADADEVAQEAFLSAWKGLPNFRGESRFSTWLYQLTTHAAIDLLRREGRYAGLEEDETLPGGLEPERAAQASAGYDALVAAVLSMPPTYREILERRLVLEQTPAEVAAAMGLRVDTVNARFSRGRKLLREKLMEEGIYP